MIEFKQFNQLVIQFGLLLCSLVQAVPPACTHLMNHEGRYTPGSDCCVNPLGIVECLSIESKKKSAQGTKNLIPKFMGKPFYSKESKKEFRSQFFLPKNMAGDFSADSIYFFVTFNDSGTNETLHSNCEISLKTEEINCEDLFTFQQLEQNKILIQEEKKHQKVREERRRKSAIENAKIAEIEANRAALAERKKWADFQSKGWSVGEIENIKNHKVWIGMTKEQAIESWGEPERNNRTINSNGTIEQWVYGIGRYLYFSNGILTTIQD